MAMLLRRSADVGVARPLHELAEGELGSGSGHKGRSEGELVVSLNSG